MTRAEQRASRRERAVFLRAMLEAGWSEREAGWILGISKQRVCQMLARELPEFDLLAVRERQMRQAWKRAAFDPELHERCRCAVCRKPFWRARGTHRPRQTCSTACAKAYQQGASYRYVGRGKGQAGRHHDWDRRKAVVLE